MIVLNTQYRFFYSIGEDVHSKNRLAHVDALFAKLKV